MPGKEDPGRQFHKMRTYSPGDSPKTTPTYKVPTYVKSFSHELGPKGGMQSAHPRAHSYNDLKVYLILNAS